MPSTTPDEGPAAAPAAEQIPLLAIPEAPPAPAPAAAPPAAPWDKKNALKTYQIRRWGAKYFDINSAGHVVVTPRREAGGEVDMYELILQARARDLRFPMLVRFQDVLRDRVVELNESFQRAIAAAEYQGRYQGVFPVKVNQLREVVEEILDAGKPYHYGLEVGSKGELCAAMALTAGAEQLIVANGYKDDVFIRTALMGRRIGKNIILVVEKFAELPVILAAARAAGVAPALGLRVRLQTRGGGKWDQSGGENAKFGLSTAELVEAVALLRRENLLDAFQLLHFHIGSQIPNIRAIKRAVNEGARFYAKLRQEGCPIAFLDIGGGLAVDYDGSRTSEDSSANYTLQEYTNTVVAAVAEVCNAEQVEHPNLVSESGRAVVAHHSVLIIEAFAALEKPRLAVEPPPGKNGGAHPLVRQLRRIQKKLPALGRLEAYHDALERKEQAQQLFALGYLSLADKALVETLFWEICRQLGDLCRQEESDLPQELEQLAVALADQYICNFSLFQSLLDNWALNQLFPIVPIHRLDEQPTREASLVDITCDSEGKVDSFIGGKSYRQTLPLHELRPGEPYYLGAFLVGAYQDIMGDLHNLFGRVNEIHVFLDPDEPCGYYIEEIIAGSSIGQILQDVQYFETDLARLMKAQVDQAVREDRVKPSEGMALLDEYEAVLKEYTYLTFDNGSR
ncbi:MAG TPA: biosynthetic arginine decarboxylase [Verrucomicrobiota bacterium]|nr:biosynthetic arginine decarboxylase [Verrucomicrobiota bacterium]HQL77146.1 biosynthetic arginine decarboxylase [Verrucomicrobiota bacterium]